MLDATTRRPSHPLRAEAVLLFALAVWRACELQYLDKVSRSYQYDEVAHQPCEVVGRRGCGRDLDEGSTHPALYPTGSSVIEVK